MKSGAPSELGATTHSIINAVAYCDCGGCVNPRLHWSKLHPAAPSCSVPWGSPTQQQISTGRLPAEPERAGFAVIGQQRERPSTDHRFRQGGLTRPRGRREGADTANESLSNRRSCTRIPGARAAPRVPAGSAFAYGIHRRYGGLPRAWRARPTLAIPALNSSPGAARHQTRPAESHLLQTSESSHH